MGDDVKDVQDPRSRDGDTAQAMTIAPPAAADVDEQATREPSVPAPVVSHVAVARSIYGLLIVMTVLEAMEVHPPHAGWAGPELLAGTLVAVGGAGGYSGGFGGGVVPQPGVCRGGVRHRGPGAGAPPLRRPPPGGGRGL